MYIKYKYSVTSTTPTQIRSTPAYAPISKVDVLCASQTVESLLNYNVYMNKKVQTTMNNSMKYCVAPSYGYQNRYGLVNASNLDGRYSEANAGVFSVAAPLDCCLTNVKDTFVPACFMSNLRINITFDSIQNVFAAVPAVAADANTGAAGQQALEATSQSALLVMFSCATHQPIFLQKLKNCYVNNIVLG